VRAVRSLRRFQAEAIAAKLTIVEYVKTSPRKVGASSAQVALAWVPGQRAHSPSRARAAQRGSTKALPPPT
jgi:aryl-alcohol dehydrogenase-like predicted oxidoreductase